MDKISVNGTSFVDEKGRERIFNGVNLVFKGELSEDKTHHNFKPEWTEEMFKDLSEMGINLIRFGLIWAAVEPKPGQYDEDYLNHMEKYINICCKYGIYVYLDMHQDLYSIDFGTGAPSWATVTDSYTFKAPKLIWAAGYYFSKAVQRSLDNFWDNEHVCGKGLQDWYCDMWKHVAERFKDKENLFGFDIFNEPCPGTQGGKAVKKIIKSGMKTILSDKVHKIDAIKRMISDDIATGALGAIDDKKVFRSLTTGGDLIIKNFDVNKYYPFFQKIAAGIREVTDKGIIIMETSYYSNTGIPCSTPRLRYKDGTYEKNLAFGPHGYDLTVDSVMTNTASNNRIDAIYDEHERTQKRLNVPAIAAEWGGMVPGCEEYPHLEYLLEKFDSNKWSQTYWAFWDGLQYEKIMKIISRPYPVAVPGSIDKYGFNRKNNTFTLKFSNEKVTRKKVEIYSPTEPKEIEAKGKYTIKYIGDSDAVIISCTAHKGENEILIKI